MKFSFLLATTTASSLRAGRTGSSVLNHLRQRHGSAASKVLQHESVATKAMGETGHSDITMRDGLGENLPYAGSDYLGMGYNLVYGNPQGDGVSLVDPGFTQPVVKLEWDQDAAFNTRDLRDLQPKQGYAYPEIACHHSSENTEVSSMSDYKTELAQDATVNAAVEAHGSYGAVEASAEASFAMSSGSSSFKNEIEGTENVRFVSKSYCVQSKAGLHLPASSLPLMPYFENWVAKLPYVEGVPIDGECATYECSTFHLPSQDGAGRYMVGPDNVGIAGPVTMAEHPSTTGTWLRDHQTFYWVGITDSKREGSMVLTHKAGTLTVAALVDTTAASETQAWSFDPKTDTLFLVASGSHAKSWTTQPKSEGKICRDHPGRAATAERTAACKNMGYYGAEDVGPDQKPKGTCKDKEGWTNAPGNTKKCSDYSEWCEAGAAKAGANWALGKVYGYPEKNCCICGKGETIPVCKFTMQRCEAQCAEYVWANFASLGADESCVCTAVCAPGSKKTGTAKRRLRPAMQTRTTVERVAGELKVSEGDVSNPKRAVRKNFFDRKAATVWDQFFTEFGSHFVSSVKLGGRMTTTYEMSKSDRDTITSAGVSASAAIAASVSAEVDTVFASGGGSASAGLSGSMAASDASVNQLKKSAVTEKTMVLGGDPSSKEDGFSVWAETVAAKPMPVQYQLTAIADTAPFRCDEKHQGPYTPTEIKCNKLRVAFVSFWNQFQAGAVKAVVAAIPPMTVRTYNSVAEGVAYTGDLLWPSFNGYPGADRPLIVSENKKYNLVVTPQGQTIIYGPIGVVWNPTQGCGGNSHTKAVFAMQGDATVAIYCSGGPANGGTAPWVVHAGKCGHHTDTHPLTIRLQNNGDLVLQRGSENVWHSNTGDASATQASKTGQFIGTCAKK